MSKQQLKSYQATSNKGYNTLKQLAIKNNGIVNMHELLIKILHDTTIKNLLANKVLKVVKTQDEIWFLCIHGNSTLNKIVCKKLFGNHRAYKTVYKDMPLVNYACNRLKTLTNGLSFNHPMNINDNLKEHLASKRELNKKWVYAIGISNSMIDYEKFIGILGHEYYNKRNVKQATEQYRIGCEKI